MDKFAIATTSGGYKNAFTQGVLTLFEEKEFVADAYGACSSSAMVAALAAAKKLKDFSLEVWYEGFVISQLENKSQSDAAFYAIDLIYPLIEMEMFESAQRFLVTTSFVNNEDAALTTQTEMSRRLGQKLLIEASKKITTWRDENLDLHLFDTRECDRTYLITDNNIKEVLYATTRMLHAWHIPAYINGKPYVDGSYTSLCPAIKLTELGYKQVICVTTEHEKTSLDLFSEDVIPGKINGAEIAFIKPDFDLTKLGVDYFKTTESGIEKAFLHGIEKGREYLQNNFK